MQGRPKVWSVLEKVVLHENIGFDHGPYRSPKHVQDRQTRDTKHPVAPKQKDIPFR